MRRQRNYSDDSRRRLRIASKKGNAARQAKTTPAQRSAIARLGGLARWGKRPAHPIEEHTPV
jgi:hypothetical protein